MNPEITLSKLRQNLTDTKFIKAYEKIMVNNDSKKFSEDELFLLLKTAIIFLNYGDDILQKLAYRIFLRYANVVNDYKPLYQVAVIKDYIPVVKHIEERGYISTSDDSFVDTFSSAYEENFKQNDIYLSLGQKEIISFANKAENSFTLVAPTSYGKSDIVIRLIEKNLDSKQCVIVPTKALLAQTRKRIMANEELAKKVGRVITHPDMWSKREEKQCVAVLTQERLLRLIQKNPEIYFDYVLVDEAHNLLSADPRAELLAQVLIILKKRNKKVKYRFFTPFLVEPDNLNIPYVKDKVEAKKTDEQIKVEKFFVYDFQSADKELLLYDQFTNQFISVPHPAFKDDISFVMGNAADKNIVYLNKTKDLEDVALRLAKKAARKEESQKDQDIEEFCSAISDYLHKEYKLIECIKSGVLYHHGVMPDIVRLYVEHIFTDTKKIKYIVTSSTLLEGVNIPAEKMFILDTRIGRRNLSPVQFKNLVGRVCRFSEIFNEEESGIRMLEPSIYVLNGEFTRVGSNIKNLIQKSVNLSKKIKDSKQNVLLLENDDSENAEQIKKSLEYLENIEPNSIKNTDEIRYVTSKIAKSCFHNNIKGFNIYDQEDALVKLFEELPQNKVINSVNEIIDEIAFLFVPLLNEKENDAGVMIRLGEEAARKFYSMFLSWRMEGSSYNMMINKFLKYWEKSPETLTYVGIKWGEVKRNETDFIPLYVNIKEKSHAERVNIAIVRIKEEQDFIDNTLMKYVEILNDMERVDKKLYEKIKYGTSDPNMICLLKNGFSIDLARCLLNEKYNDYIKLDLKNDSVSLEDSLIEEMHVNNENSLLIFEAGYHLG